MMLTDGPSPVFPRSPDSHPKKFFFQRRHCAAVVTTRQHAWSGDEDEEEEMALILPMRDKLPMAKA